LLVELRKDVALFYAVVFLHQEANDVPGDRLRGDVDDVGLHKGVLGDRVRLAVGPPGVGKKNRQPGQDYQPSQPKESREQPPGRRRGWGGRGGPWRPGRECCGRGRCGHGWLRSKSCNLVWSSGWASLAACGLAFALSQSQAASAVQASPAPCSP